MITKFFNTRSGFTPAHKRQFWLLVGLWAIAIGGSLVWNVHQVKQNTLEIARIQAVTTFEKDILARHWNARHGGVYVKVTQDTLPNPYLAKIPERDIKTPSGKSLTLMNPAYMTRQMNEIAEKEYTFRGHITSLKPIRPENAPDPWEAKALKAFMKEGTLEVSSREKINNREYLRLMRPLRTEESCLKCHADQGYKVGDIRGGISVSILIDPLLEMMRKRVHMLSLGHALLWLVGMTGIILGTIQQNKSEQERDRAEQESEGRYRALFENSPVALWEQDWSEIKIFFDTLHNQGVTDFRAYFKNHPDAIRRCAGLNKVIDVNKAALELFKAQNKEELLNNLDKISLPESQETLINVLASAAEGRATFESEIVGRTLTGEKRYIALKRIAIPGSEKNFSRILSAEVDITELKQSGERLRESLEKLRKTTEGVVRTIEQAIEVRDPYTAGHQRRVADLARMIAREMGLAEDDVDGIHMAGVIHDLGKIAVPSEILSKPTKLTEIEYGLIKVHPEAGYNILKDIEFPWPIAQMVLQHHERQDGSGYPAGLKGEHILVQSRILALADVIEAMASDRPYRPGLGIEKALGEIKRNPDIIYDPQVVDACLKLFYEKGYELK